MDKDMERAVRKIVAALERNALATEKMLALAEREEMVFEQGPPICPGCGALNPTITMLDTGQDTGQDSGPLGEFVISGETHCCNRTIYAIPNSLSVVSDIETARALMAEKKGGQR